MIIIHLIWTVTGRFSFLRKMFSIIIPLYNKKESILRTLASVLSQSGADFEVIVVDDGSTDGSGDLVLDVKDSRLRYYWKENEGVSSARNFGMQISKGEWILLLDADDELVEGTLAYWKSIIPKYSSCLVFVGQESHKDISFENIRERRAVFPYFLIWLSAFFPSSGNILFHRSILSKCGMMDERMSFFEDYEFGLRILLSNKVVYSTRTIRIYHQQPGGLSTTHHKITKDMAYYLPEKLSAYPFWGKALWYENLEYMLFWNSKNPEDREYYKQMRAHYFGFIYSILHNVRQRLINHKWI